MWVLEIRDFDMSNVVSGMDDIGGGLARVFRCVVLYCVSGFGGLMGCFVECCVVDWKARFFEGRFVILLGGCWNAFELVKLMLTR